MPWHQFWKRDKDTAEPEATPEPEAKPATGTALPPHMQQIVEERRRPAGQGDGRVRLARLERERMAAMFDIDQGELASSPDNPWQQRIGLLTDAMATVQEDIARERVVVPSPFAPLPPTPVTGITVKAESPAEVRFAVGDEGFLYAEEQDWADRSRQVMQGELRHRSGSVEAVVPVDIDASLRPALVDHLDESLFVFASDLRDRMLDQEALPDGVTLDQMAPPCPKCGGWMDWRGRCQACRARDAALQALRREENRLLSERAREAEEQHRLKERLPLARRKLNDIETEIAQLQGQM